MNACCPGSGIIRLDLRGRPFVVLDGGLMVRETPSRKNAGAHYTPSRWPRKSSCTRCSRCATRPAPTRPPTKRSGNSSPPTTCSSLKVADIACGSGAFLVAAARYLADRVVEAWTAEDPANAAPQATCTRRAIREVVANCLYGADINDMAVEMCKLSLWLVSLDRDLPFSFVDDKIFLGNSLLGLTSLDQLRKLHIDPSRVPAGEMFDIFDVDIDAIIHKAADLRRKLASEIDENDPARNSAAKRRQLAQLHDVTADLRKIADGVIAAGLPLGGKPGKALDEAYENLRVAVKAAHPEAGEPTRRCSTRSSSTASPRRSTTDYERWQPTPLGDRSARRDRRTRRFRRGHRQPTVPWRARSSPARWAPNIRDWLVNVLAGGQRGSADRSPTSSCGASRLLSGARNLGLIATNTIAQGDTREVGLDQMVDGGFTITRAIQSRSWPAASANLEYAAVWGTVGSVSAERADALATMRRSGGSRPCSSLRGRVEGNPMRLGRERRHRVPGLHTCWGWASFLSPTRPRRGSRRTPRNAEVLFPYLNGEDLNSRPDCSASRWVIDFNDRCRDEAVAVTRCPCARVQRTVKPERREESNRQVASRASGGNSPRQRPALRTAIADLDEVLVIAQVSKTRHAVRVPTGQVFSSQVGRVRDRLVRRSGRAVVEPSSAVGDQVRLDDAEPTCSYTPSDVFETFPRPAATDWLERIGRTLDAERREIMLRRELGLTKLYNLVNDPADHRRLRSRCGADAGHSRRARRGGDGCLRLVGHPARPRLPHLSADAALDGESGGAGGDSGSAAGGEPPPGRRGSKADTATEKQRPSRQERVRRARDTAVMTNATENAEGTGVVPTS